MVFSLVFLILDYPSVETSPTDKAIKSTTEQPLKVTNFIQPREDHTDANKLQQFTETLANEDEVNKVIEKCKYYQFLIHSALK